MRPENVAARRIVRLFLFLLALPMSAHADPRYDITVLSGIEAASVNELGQVAGLGPGGSFGGGQRALLYSDGAVIDRATVSVLLNPVAAVPEPAMAFMSFAGVCLLGMVFRRRGMTRIAANS